MPARSPSRPKPTMARSMVFRVCLNIYYLNGAPFEQNPAYSGLSTRANGRTLPKRQKFARQILSCYCSAEFAFVPKNHSSWCTTEPHGRTHERVEHGLQIEGRAADRLKYIGGGGLLLKRLPQFVQQPRVLD